MAMDKISSPKNGSFPNAAVVKRLPFGRKFQLIADKYKSGDGAENDGVPKGSGHGNGGLFDGIIF